MNITQIIKNRDCGELKISFLSNWDYPLGKIIEKFGLVPESDHIGNIPVEEAKQIVEALLWKDLAYSGEIMPLEAARKYTDYLFAEVVPEASEFYTNGDWQNYHNSKSSGWTPCTDATFDGGIIAVSKNMAFLFWVEDED